MKNSYYQLIYTVVLYFITMYITPLAILLCMNVLLIKHINRARHKRSSLTSHKPKILKRNVGLPKLIQRQPNQNHLRYRPSIVSMNVLLCYVLHRANLLALIVWDESPPPPNQTN